MQQNSTLAHLHGIGKTATATLKPAFLESKIVSGTALIKLEKWPHLDIFTKLCLLTVKSLNPKAALAYFPVP